MSDINANVLIAMPSQPFTMARAFKAVANGEIFVGLVNTDPTNPANQIQVYIENEDGTHVPVPQPLRVNSGGFPVYNGQIVKFVTVQNYSMEVRDSYGAQQFYFADVLKYAPDQLREQISDPDGAEKYPSLQIARWRDDGDVRGWGADTGAADNTASFNGAKAEAPDGNAYIPGGVFELGATDPDFNLHGPGAIRANGVTSKVTNIVRKVARESVFFTPDSYQRERYGINFPTPRDPLYNGSSYNFVFSQGSKMNDITKNLRYNVVFGNMNGCAPNDWSYNDIFGNDSAIYAYNIQRNTAIGSETIPWFGAPDQQWLRTYQHDWWRKPADNPYEPGEPGWNAGGLETLFPGIGNRINQFNAYATTSDGAARCVAVGRDALGHIVAGQRNTAVGYQCAGNLFSGSYNVAMGALSLGQVVFCDAVTAIGDSAGRDCLDSTNTAFFGYGAGRTLQKASFSVVIGDRAADGKLSAENSILIGSLVGAGIPEGQLDNILAIGSKTNPLIGGDFLKDQVGINILPKNTRAKLHIRNTNSGSTQTIDTGILVEAGSVAACTLETASTGVGRIKFADVESSGSGIIEYTHNGDNMTFHTAGAPRVRVESSGIFRPIVDNTNTLGTAGGRWSVVYAGTGSINTSDESEKDRMDILEAEKAAALEIKRDIWKFKFKDAIDVKGEGARIHFGVGAQSVGEILRKHGLNPDDYAFYCYDKWDAEYEPVYGKRKVTTEVQVTKNDAITGYPFDTTELVEVEEEYDTGEKVCTLEAGERYGIRYEELLCFIIAAI